MSHLAVQTSEPLSRHTLLQIGGPARFFIQTTSADEVVAAVRAARSRGLPYVMLGAGSNVLVSDRGYPGVVIKTGGAEIAIRGHSVEVDAGAMMARVAAQASRAGLAGFEWAVGIPGTVGGSVVGNAGCFGSEMKDVVASVRIYDATTDRVRLLSGPECKFDYRESMLKRHPEFVVLGATLALRAGDPAASQRRIREISAARINPLAGRLGRAFFNPEGTSLGQEVGVPTAGSTFKNVLWSRLGVEQRTLIEEFPALAPFAGDPGISAGFLIDRAGLKGHRIGGAEISRRHGNFIVNVGSATAADVVALIEFMKARVRELFGITLEEEIRFIGFDGDSVVERM